MEWHHVFDIPEESKVPTTTLRRRERIPFLATPMRGWGAESMELVTLTDTTDMRCWHKHFDAPCASAQRIRPKPVPCQAATPFVWRFWRFWRSAGSAEGREIRIADTLIARVSVAGLSCVSFHLDSDTSPNMFSASLFLFFRLLAAP